MTNQVTREQVEALEHLRSAEQQLSPSDDALIAGKIRTALAILQGDSALEHLRSALAQSLPSDDQIIMGHVRAAAGCLEKARVRP